MEGARHKVGTSEKVMQPDVDTVENKDGTTPSAVNKLLSRNIDSGIEVDLEDGFKRHIEFTPEDEEPMEEDDKTTQYTTAGNHASNTSDEKDIAQENFVAFGDKFRNISVYERDNKRTGTTTSFNTSVTKMSGSVQRRRRSKRFLSAEEQKQLFDKIHGPFINREAVVRPQEFYDLLLVHSARQEAGKQQENQNTDSSSMKQYLDFSRISLGGGTLKGVSNAWTQTDKANERDETDDE